MKTKPLFRAVWKDRKGMHYGPTEPTPELARKSIPDRASVATIQRDSQGADHPDNAGKFFLHEIIK